MFRYDYSKIDPIIKKNPDISSSDFKKECKVNISNWAFMARKKFIKGEPGYGRVLPKKVKATATDDSSIITLAADGLVTLKGGRNVTLDELIAEMYPNGTIMDQYKVVAEALLKDPLTTHSSMINSGAITMSDSGYYGFRRKFTKIMGLKSKGKYGISKKVSSTEMPIKINRKKHTLFQTIFEKKVGENFDSNSMSLLEEFVEVLNQDKIMNLEIFEIVRPCHIIEIRKFSR